MAMAIVVILRRQRTESISIPPFFESLNFTLPNLVSYQKVLNKSQNFSSPRKFSLTVFACHEIKK